MGVVSLSIGVGNGMSLPYNGDGVILEVLDFSIGKFSAMVVRDEELVGSFGGLKKTFKSLDTLLFSRWCCVGSRRN